MGGVGEGVDAGVSGKEGNGECIHSTKLFKKSVEASNI